jgi:hypothetical protein
MKITENKKRVVIFGSRSIYSEVAKKIILDELDELNPGLIITSGETRGVCEMVREIAKELAVPLELHWLNRDKYAGGIFEHRAKECLTNADYCILIHDGVSKGTLGEYKLAQKMGIRHKYIILKNKSMEFTLEQIRFEFN